MKYLILLFLVSCTSIKEIDKPVCVEISISRGYCTTIISGQGFYVDDTNLFEGETWFSLRPKNIQVPPTTWAAIKSYLIKNCKKSGSCSENIDSWNRSMTSIDSVMNEKLTDVHEAPSNGGSN